jgi:RNA polymerase sigma-70 factor (ECF subfamily)
MVKGLRRLDDPACFPRWAYQVVTRRSTDWIRETFRRRKLNERAAVELRDEKEPNHVADDIDAVRVAIRKLPPEQRSLLVMHYLDGLSIAEIAEALGIPLGTVKSRLFAIRSELKGLLEPDIFPPMQNNAR